MNQTINTAITHINPQFKHVLEFGVFKGKTVKQLRQSFDSSYKVFGFDSFEGLPEKWTGTTVDPKSFSTNGVIPNVDGVQFYKGWFSETLPLYLPIAQPIALLHMDCDLYSSTKQVLWDLNDYIVPGTVIVFDEWYYNHLDVEKNRQHEQKAFYEWVQEFNRTYTLLPEIEEERKIAIII